MQNGGEEAKIAAFEAARQPILHDLMALPEPSDRAQGLKHLAALHAEFERFYVRVYISVL